MLVLAFIIRAHSYAARAPKADIYASESRIGGDAAQGESICSWLSGGATDVAVADGFHSRFAAAVVVVVAAVSDL